MARNPTHGFCFVVVICFSNGPGNGCRQTSEYTPPGSRRPSGAYIVCFFFVRLCPRAKVIIERRLSRRFYREIIRTVIRGNNRDDDPRDQSPSSSRSSELYTAKFDRVSIQTLLRRYDSTSRRGTTSESKNKPCVFFVYNFTRDRNDRFQFYKRRSFV